MDACMKMVDLLHKEWEPIPFSPPPFQSIQGAIGDTNFCNKTWRSKIPNLTFHKRIEECVQQIEPVHRNQEGSWNRRFSKMWDRLYADLPLQDKSKTELGELCLQGYTRFVLGPFEWLAGTYGDHDSCFMDDGSRSAARHWMGKVGVYAHQIAKDPAGERGIGRCWVWPHERGILFWNGYGRDTQSHAKAFATKHRLQSYAASLVCAGDDENTIYCNGETVFCYPEDSQEWLDSQEFNGTIDLVQMGFPLPTCEGCKDENLANFYHRDGLFYCYDCAVGCGIIDPEDDWW